MIMYEVNTNSHLALKLRETFQIEQELSYEKNTDLMTEFCSFNFFIKNLLCNFHFPGTSTEQVWPE